MTDDSPTTTLTTDIDATTATEIEAAVFRRFLEHLDSRKDVQNIELMTLANFCRNCLSKWYVKAAGEKGLDVDLESARERIYGMPYGEWKARYQTEATPEQLAAFEAQQQQKQEQQQQQQQQ